MNRSPSRAALLDGLSAGEDSDGFDVGGLREEVEQVQLGDRVAGGGECGEVGGQGLRRAGDVDQRGCGDAAEQVADVGVGAGARRVEDDERGVVAVDDGGAQEVERGGFDGAQVGQGWLLLRWFELWGLRGSIGPGGGRGSGRRRRRLR